MIQGRRMSFKIDRAQPNLRTWKMNQEGAWTCDFAVPRNVAEEASSILARIAVLLAMDPKL